MRSCGSLTPGTPMVVCSLWDCPWLSELRPISSDGCKECILKFSERLIEAFISQWRHGRNVAFLSFGLSYIEGFSKDGRMESDAFWVRKIDFRAELHRRLSRFLIFNFLQCKNVKSSRMAAIPGRGNDLSSSCDRWDEMWQKAKQKGWPGFELRP